MVTNILVKDMENHNNSSKAIIRFTSCDLVVSFAFANSRRHKETNDKESTVRPTSFKTLATSPFLD